MTRSSGQSTLSAGVATPVSHPAVLEALHVSLRPAPRGDAPFLGMVSGFPGSEHRTDGVVIAPLVGFAPETEIAHVPRPEPEPFVLDEILISADF